MIIRINNFSVKPMQVHNGNFIGTEGKQLEKMKNKKCHVRN